MIQEGTLQVSRCSSCHAGFLPRPWSCPRCGSRNVTPTEIPARGVVLAATELYAPATGWTAPHRLALVEMAEGIRLLAVVSGDLPRARDVVRVTATGGTFQVG